MENKEQGKPPESAAATVHPVGGADEATTAGDEELVARSWLSSQYLRKRRCALCCCGCCSVTVLILGVVAIVLAFTVFKVEDPVLTMNSIHVDSIKLETGTLSNPLSANATLTADISIKNPNVASFQFDRSTTEFYYEGETVGVAYAPDGRVSAHSTVRMNVTVDVLVDRVVQQPNMTAAMAFGGEVNLTSYTVLNGRVNVLGIYKRDVGVFVNCSMTLDGSLIAQDVKNKVCVADVM